MSNRTVASCSASEYRMRRRSVRCAATCTASRLPRCGPIWMRCAQRPSTIIAALGPRMLALAAELADGAHPYNVPPQHTAEARRLLGPDKLLYPEQMVVLETNPAEARRIARHAFKSTGMPARIMCASSRYALKTRGKLWMNGYLNYWPRPPMRNNRDSM